MINEKFVFKFLDKRRLLISLVLLLILDFIYMFVPFSFTLFLTLPFTFEKAIIIALIFIFSKLLRTFLLYIWRVYTDKYLYRYSRKLLFEYYREVERIPINELNKYQTGYIQNIINNLIDVSKNLLTQDYFYIIFGLFFFYYTVFTQSFWIGSICLLSGIICLVLSIIILKKANRNLHTLYQEENKYNAVYQDIISNIRTVKLLGNNSFFEKKIDLMSNKCIEKSDKYIKNYSFEEVVRNFLIFVPFALAMIKAVYDLSIGIDTLGIITFYIYQNSEMGSVFNGMSGNILEWFKLRVLLHQTNDLFSHAKDSNYITDLKSLKIKDAVIKYEDLSSEINVPEFICNKNDKICIYGKSGQGKTTLLNLIIGNINCVSGKILIDNKENKNDILDAGFVGQEIEIFNTTIRENLCLGRKISDKELFESLKQLDLFDFIMSLENGLDTYVGEKGLKLSTGQKRRINLLRSYLMEKEIYILDEPTANLDVKTEEIVCDFIKNNFCDKTLIISTHNKMIENICNKFYYFNDHTLHKK